LANSFQADLLYNLSGVTLDFDSCFFLELVNEIIEIIDYIDHYAILIFPIPFT